MNTNFIRYLDQLELLVFFSAYPLLYTVITVLFGNKQIGNKFKIPALLPCGYALTGIFYLGLQLKNLYPDYSFEYLRGAITPLKLLALTSLLFWFPLFSRRPLISLLHSLIFFSLLAKDLLLHALEQEVDKETIRNDMKVFTVSLLLNTASLIIIFVFTYLWMFFKKNKQRAQTPVML
jgi:hypothetical protein